MSGEGAAAILGIILLVYVIVMIVAIVLGVLNLIALWKLYEKAGEPGWSAIVPVYNFIQMIKIGTGEYKVLWAYLILWGAYMVLGIISGVLGGITEAMTDSSIMLSLISLVMSLIIMVTGIGMAVIGGYMSYMFSKSYGKNTTFCVLSIFFFPITNIIMGFDKTITYVGPKGVPKNGYPNYY